MNKACVVIPTYNEAENIKPLLEELETAFENVSDYEMHIVVADDTSPDSTADIVEHMAKTYDNIHLLLGEKEGMGAAYIRAFSQVLDSYDVVITMDADFSHPPAMISDFLEKIDSGCDMVIGSRYIPGGGAPDWPVKRRLISSLANVFARTVAGVYTVHDCTSNYRAYRTSILRKVPLRRLSNKGYAFVTTCLWEMYHQKAQICEIPLVFYDRQKGETKLGSSDITEFFLNCFRLRMRSFSFSSK
ncbi:MAG: polyprenol monophosphomannose synthase [Theionarchaea archaeon]|nr:polyprenol monophosphomannose synthase [Theionarchaea archaeon]